VHPEAVEGLLQEGVLAEGGLPPEAFAAVGAGEQASRQGHRVAKREGGVVRGPSEELLPEALLDLPEVGRLPSEGGAMDLAERGEPLGVVPPEVAADGLVGVSRPRNSPTISMVMTSASESLGEGPRWRMRSPLSRSSTRQKTATMKVLRSTRRGLLRFDWFGHRRA
jgi:hypothetical protein